MGTAQLFASQLSWTGGLSFFTLLLLLHLLCFALDFCIGVFTTSSVLSLFSAPCLAASSAVSLPSVPIWAFTQASVHFLVCYAMFSIDSAVFSAMFDLKSMLFRAVNILTYLGLRVLYFVSRYLQAWYIASSSAWKTVAWFSILKLCECI